MPTPSKNGSTVTQKVESAASLTVAFTVAAGSNRCLLVRLGANILWTDTVTVTYGGIALTRVGGAQFNGGDGWTEIWHLLAPTIGTANVVITAPATVTYIWAVIDQWDGVDQTTPFGEVSTYTPNFGEASWSYDVASAAEDLVVDAVTTFRGEPYTQALGPNQSEDGHIGLISDAGQGWAGHEVAGGATTQISYTTSLSAQPMAVAVAMKGAALTVVVTVAGTVTTGDGGTGQSSLSFDWNNNANANYLAVCVGAWSPLPTGVTYNGVPLTQLVSGDFNNYTARIYGLVHPPLGNHSVVITYSDDISETAAAAIGLANVNIASPTGIPDSAGANGGDLTLAPNSVAGALALGVLFCHANPTPAGTQQFERNPVSGFAETYFNGQTVVGAPVTVNVSWTMAANQRVGAAIAFLPGAGGETFHESLAFDLNAGATPAARAIFGSALSLSMAAAIEPPTGRAVIGAALSLNTAATIEPPARLTANVLTTLSAQTVMAPEMLLAVITQVGLSSHAVFTTDSQRALAAAVTLNAGTSFATRAILAGIGRLTLTAAGLADMAMQLTVPTLVSLGAAATLTPKSQFTGVGTVALDADAGVTPASRLVASALQAFTALAALDTFTGEQIIQEQLSLTAAAGVSPTARAVLIAQQTLELHAQLSAAYRAIIHVAVDYAAQAQATPTATAVVGAELALQVQALVNARATGTMRDAVTLAIATALDTAASLGDAPAAVVLKAVADKLRAATATDETLTA